MVVFIEEFNGLTKSEKRLRSLFLFTAAIEILFFFRFDPELFISNVLAFSLLYYFCFYRTTTFLLSCTFLSGLASLLYSLYILMIFPPESPLLLLAPLVHLSLMTLALYLRRINIVLQIRFVEKKDSSLFSSWDFASSEEELKKKFRSALVQFPQAPQGLHNEYQKKRKYLLNSKKS